MLLLLLTITPLLPFRLPHFLLQVVVFMTKNNLILNLLLPSPPHLLLLDSSVAWKILAPHFQSAPSIVHGKQQDMAQIAAEEHWIILRNMALPGEAVAWCCFAQSFSSTASTSMGSSWLPCQKLTERTGIAQNDRALKKRTKNRARN